MSETSNLPISYAALSRRRAGQLGAFTRKKNEFMNVDFQDTTIPKLTEMKNSILALSQSHQEIISALFDCDEANVDDILAEAEKFDKPCQELMNKINEAITLKELKLSENDLDAQRDLIISYSEMMNNQQAVDPIDAERFETILDELPSLRNAYVDTTQEIIRYSNEARQAELNELLKEFRELYLNVYSWFRGKVQAAKASSQPIIEILDTSMPNMRNKGATPKIKLPTLELPKYDGSPETWVTFRDSFDSIIHKNTELTNSTKFRYLKMSITDKMSPVAATLETNDGYLDAYQTVIDYYDDKRIIFEKHVTALVSAKRMSSATGEELQRLLNEFINNTSALERMMSKEALYDSMIAHFILFRLDPETRKHCEIENKREIPQWPEVKALLERHRKVLKTLPISKASKSAEIQKTQKSTAFTKSPWSKPSNVNLISNSEKPAACASCKENHFLWQCPQFLNLDVKQRCKKLDELKLCTNCFGNHSTAKCLSKRTCRVCKQKHHTLIHHEEKAILIQQSHESPVIDSSSEAEDDEISYSVNTTSNSSVIATDTFTFLSTAIIRVQDILGNWHNFRALLDSGADANYITSSAAKKLRHILQIANVIANGFGDKPQKIKSKIKAMISNRDESFKDELEFLLTNKITGLHPSRKIDLRNIKFPENISLADPSFDIAGPIDILLSNELYLDLLLNGRFKLANGLSLRETAFGWIIGGKASINQMVTIRTCNLIRQSDLRETMEKFYKEEDYRNHKGFLTEEERFCEETFEQTHKRAADGRFIIQIPLKDNVDQVLDNRKQALSQFLATEKRLSKKENEPLRDEYIKFMREYESLGHMTEMTTQPSENSTIYYLPHHPVVKPDSTTTKVRIVFNASAKTKSGLSFNDVQCIGPQIQSDAFTLGLKFRQHNVIIKADIAKMYRQIEVIPEQRKLQLILWRESPHDPIKTYELNTVTYGTSSASFQSTRCLKQLAIEHKDKYPEASHEVETGMYVDDLISGAKTIEEAIQLFRDIDIIISAGAMKARKLCSNSQEFLNAFPVEDHDTANPDDTTMKALGIKWDPVTDQIMFEIKDIAVTKITKRIVLSEISKIYDPEGLLGPVIFKFKLFMKKVWLLKISWDEPLPQKETEEWIAIASTFSQLRSIRIRRLFCLSTYISIHIHGFSDASEQGFGACIYIRSEDSIGNSASHLICAKNRLSPTARTSIARLELCGAVVMAHLMQKVETALSIPIHKKFFWMDSAIVLYWLKKSPTQLQPYVANRVSEIQEMSKNTSWRHIRGEQNPADLISRGLMPEDIINNNFWYHGPEFLTSPEAQWPISILTIEPEEAAYKSEFRKVHVYAVRRQFYLPTDNPFIGIMEKRSRLYSIKYSLAIIRRFLNNIAARKHQLPSVIGPITIIELKEAENLIIREHQKVFFHQEYEMLRCDQLISTSSTIKNLDPFFDEETLTIRVGGRLRNATHIDSQQKHPILLPKSRLSSMIVREIHQQNLHPGQQATLSFIRLKYWPIRGKDIVRHEIRHCVRCFKAKPKMIEQFMGQLPQARVTPSPPFYNTGVDYAGPIDIKSGYARNAPMKKCYIAIFVCLATKAIHLEIVSELSTKAFCVAMDRFTARRGLCGHMHSDNGTNFVGAKNELEEFRNFINNPTVQTEIRYHLVKQEIVWHLIPPRAPEHGGLWEAGVKSMKHHLKRIAHNSKFNYEELSTLVCRIEAILNSRPIIPLSNDPNDLEALTAGHILIGRPLIAPPRKNLDDGSFTYLDRWDRVLQAQQHFWSRWSHEYLHQLQIRTKNYKRSTPVQIGSLVLVELENLPTMSWPIGRIVNIFPGRDGITRVAKIKMATTIIERPVNKLAILPVLPPGGC